MITIHDQETTHDSPGLLDTSHLFHDLQRELDGEVHFDTLYRGMYSTDASNYRQIPIGVVTPRHDQDVITALRIAREHGAPVTSRGGGTSLGGQTCNEALILDFSKHMAAVESIDPDTRTAVVQPGCVLDDLRDAAGEHGLTFGPDPATHDRCTLGGMIGNNSCGVHSQMSGRTQDYVEALEIVTAAGDRFWIGEESEEDIAAIIDRGGPRGEIYRRVFELRDQVADNVRDEFPDIPRLVSGYSLDALLPENGASLAKALVGSEGTLVTVLRAKLKLIDARPERALVVLGYEDVYHAADDVPRIAKFNPIALEGLDDLLIEYMKIKGFHTDSIPYLPEGNGWLLVEFGADTQEDANRQANEMIDALKASEHTPTIRMYDSDDEAQVVWEARESGLGATAHVPTLPLMWPGWEDSATSPENLGGYMRDLRKLMDDHGLDASYYGHFGHGLIHCRVSFDLMTADGIDNYRDFIEEAAELLTGKHNGSLSGEHGDGQARAALLPIMYSPAIMDAFREFKAIWDPDNRMNPGKLIHPDGPTDNLRLGTGYTPLTPQTVFQYREDNGSFSDASLRCVGVGKCRVRENTFMCPSYVATHDEKDSTRGRARILFEMMRGDFDTAGWASDAVHQSLDLCLGCKACLSECPVDVDMARYKAEFLHHYYKRRPRPVFDMAMGLMGYGARVGMLAPKVVNAAMKAPGLSRLIKQAAGVHPERELPPLAEQTFRAWMNGRETRNPSGPPVLLYADPFNDFFHPRSLIAAAIVLERWGFRVIVPQDPPPALRPMIHHGMLSLARWEAKRLMRALQPYIQDGTPMVVIEPSTLSLFRDDLADLIPDDLTRKRLAVQSYLLEELALDHDLPLPQRSGRALLHTHCHQKSVLDRSAGRKLLEKMGLEVEEPHPGCCGMAGSFGYEHGHFEVSMTIAEENLLPAVREEDDALLVADGFSCRSQIHDGADRWPLHISELILESWSRRR